jgi:curved DNA-binding protein CbpA
MSIFVTDLNKMLNDVTGNKPAWGDVNPLVVIGLTQSVLELGLTEDQLRTAIHSYGRQLAAQVHPDRKSTNVSPERQKQILEAFDVLDNKETFSAALAEFKTIRAEDRRESRLLSNSLSLAKKRIVEFEKKEASLRLDRETLSREISTFLAQKTDTHKELENLRRENVELSMNLDSQKKRSAELYNKSILWRRRYEHSLMTTLTLAEEHNDGVFVFKAKWVAIGQVSGQKTASSGPRKKSGKINPHFINALIYLGIGSEQETILAKWDEFLEMYGSGTPIFTLLRLDGGSQEIIFGHHLTAGKRVIGCIPRRKLSAVRSVGDTTLSETDTDHELMRSLLKQSVNHQKVSENMSSYLTVGGLLVSLYVESRRRASWSQICPAFHFSTNRIILAVG